MNTIREPARDVPVIGDWDVVVCGGGPAGVAAAVSAARAGARVHLVELYGSLGGIWTTGLLAYFLDHANKGGLMAEIIRRLEARGARAHDSRGEGTNAFDGEEVRILLDELCLEAGVGLQLYSRVVAARVEAGRLRQVVVESPSGREALSARQFIDATGNGDLGALAGCGFDLGHPETGAQQPMSLIGLLGGLRLEEVSGFVRQPGEAWAAPKDRLREAMERGGHSPSYGKPSLFPVRDDLFLLMANHEYGVKGIDARDLTAATLRGRRELHDLVNGLRRLGGPWSRLRLLATSAQIGVREGRRLHGRYTVTLDDMVAGRCHDDAVCRVAFGLDVHSTNPGAGKGIEPHPVRTQPYDIPLRALQARDVEGLWMAGRCISGDFLAHSSYRVTGNAVAMGEAVGRAAVNAAAIG
ncbi:MAG: FAD-dependent oxidoreductase [Lentisphaerae bacterium]|nr:FAD-dependent oxidoreductase [Lentisphaerota bacterium]